MSNDNELANEALRLLIDNATELARQADVRITQVTYKNITTSD